MIVPALNEAAGIRDTLMPLQVWRAEGVELILVDGGSTDATCERAEDLVDRLAACEPGRARQMNHGAGLAQAPLLWFLHADTRVDDRHLQQLARETASWGHFHVRLSGRRRLFRLIGALINLRSGLSGVATGDQALFVRRGLFRAVDGYPDQPLMEDLALCARLREQAGRAARRGPAVKTDSRRWERNGAWRTIALMWWLRWRYWRGADPGQLHRLYERGSR